LGRSGSGGSLLDKGLEDQWKVVKVEAPCVCGVVVGKKKARDVDEARSFYVLRGAASGSSRLAQPQSSKLY
jgi:hypothetical protein